MAEQKSDNEPQQQPSTKEKPQESIEILKSQRQQLADQLLVPSNLIGLASAYLLLVTAVIGFGVLAFYTGHKVTQEICFYISIPLFAVIPFVFIWRILPTRREKNQRIAASGLRERLIKLAESPTGRFMERHWRSITLCIFTLDVYNIGSAIWQFPQHPRFSLAIIVVFMTLCFGWVIGGLLGRLKIAEVQVQGHTQIIDRIIDIIVKTDKNTRAAFEMVVGEIEALKTAAPAIKKSQKAK